MKFKKEFNCKKKIFYSKKIIDNLEANNIDIYYGAINNIKDISPNIKKKLTELSSEKGLY
jgi:hypothetical protein